MDDAPIGQRPSKAAVERGVSGAGPPELSQAPGPRTGGAFAQRSERSVHLEVRPAEPADAASIARLRMSSDEQHARMLPGYFQVPATPRPVPRASPSEHVLVATRADTVVGYLVLHLSMTPPDPSLRPGPRARVDALVVDPARRRQGVGQRLMEEARILALAYGATDLVLTVWANNDAAAAFYATLGLEPLAAVLRWPLEADVRRASSRKPRRVRRRR